MEVCFLKEEIPFKFPIGYLKSGIENTQVLRGKIIAAAAALCQVEQTEYQE